MAAIAISAPSVLARGSVSMVVANTDARSAAAKTSASMAAAAISASHAVDHRFVNTAANAIPALHAAARAFVNMASNAISAADAVGRAFVSIGASATCAAFVAPILLSAGVTFLATAGPQQRHKRLPSRRSLLMAAPVRETPPDDNVQGCQVV